MVHGILICDGDPEIRGAMQRTVCGVVVTGTTSPRETLAIDMIASGIPGVPGGG